MTGSIEFDGTLFWYVDTHDPSEDRCCFCQELINEDEVPLILWMDAGRKMARIHWEPCAQSVVRQKLRLG